MGAFLFLGFLPFYLIFSYSGRGLVRRLGKCIERYGACWRCCCLSQGFQAFNSLRRKKHITTDIAYLCWNLLDHHDSITLTYRTHHFALLILSWATHNSAFHLGLLSFGLIHLGNAGTYTVMICISTHQTLTSCSWG